MSMRKRGTNTLARRELWRENDLQGFALIDRTTTHPQSSFTEGWKVAFNKCVFASLCAMIPISCPADRKEYKYTM